ncbi:molybdopterin oxidoreductase family protein [Pyrococcus abyssi]|uniref:Alpha subunit of formate dehydrogenease n=1 Tax=Pyrococcus abyssi (strain GE5 / Orsay) TaxID=272844 RepID=Q9UYM9_PYRAB|nr:molybdopterin-dependent oxidoreductase [Pyrococcus abyssi]CAB50383.1 fdhA formate dehydrogenase, alpha subunit [Pyrococcus abyssi GE5]CCE70930.1 TPA: alpha subunit of formate dehydrogenease [Pyrococcus abyssi GE5]
MAEKLIPVVCPWCSVGCRLYIVSVDGYPRKIEFDYNPKTPNKGKLCPKGVSSYQHYVHPDRLKKPLKRVGEKGEGKFEEISWEEAIEIIAKKFKEILESHGPEALAFLGSERCSLEDNYLLQKLARALGTNNVEFAGRLCQSSNFVARSKIFGGPAQTNPFDDIVKSKVILIWGYNPAATNPVLFGQYFEKAILDNGAKLIVVDPVKTETAKYAHIHLQPYPGTDLAIALAMLHVIIKEELYDKDFVAERVNNFDALARAVEKYTPEWAEKISGVPASLIHEAAVLFATGGNATVVLNEGINQHANGSITAMAISNLIAITGNIGKEGVFSGVIPGAHCGLCAAVPGVNCAQLPGPVPLNEETAKKFSELWGFEVPSKPGLHYQAIFDAMLEGKIKGIYIMGQNPARSLANSSKIEEALKRAFVVVADIFPTETTKYADIVLPAAAWYEKTGTVITQNRRVMRSFQAVKPPGEAKPDWEIIVMLAKSIGLGEYFNYSSVDDVLREINNVIPALKGATPERLAKNLEGCMYPCPDENTETPRLFLKGFPTKSGKAELIPVEWKPPGEVPDEEYPFWLTNFRLVGQFHTGTMSNRTKSLKKRWPGPYVMINERDAKRLGIRSGDLVRVETRRGSLVARAEVTENIREGVVAMPWHWGFNYLTKDDAIDEFSKMPELKTAACRISKVEG